MRVRTEDIEIVTTRLDAGTESLDVLQTFLSDVERERANRFVFDRDRRRFLVGRARLRQLLGARLGVSPESVPLTCGTNGKPAIAGGFTDVDLHFNLSRCDDIAIYAFSRGADVGVDIEAVCEIHEADEIAERFFSQKEARTFRALESRHKPLAFFNCWTRKEAFVKALGDGLSYPLDHFDVSLTPGHPARILRVGDTPGDQCGWRIKSLSPAPGFVAAVVTRSVEASAA
jgi:4'-phosphopantetheinyl transferase